MARRSPEGILSNAKGIFQGDKSVRGEPMSELKRQVEVRFEWTPTERGGTGKTHGVGVGGAEVTTGLGAGDGPGNASGRNSAALTSSDNSANTAREGEDGHTIVSYRRRQSRFGLISKRSMESTRSRSPK